MIQKNSCDRTLDQVLEAHGVAWDMFADSLLEASKNGCTAVAKDGVVLYANRMAREGLGILPGSFMTERVPELALRDRGRPVRHCGSRAGRCCTGATPST